MKRFSKILLLILGTVTLLGVLVAIFFIRHDAPLLKGKLEYSIDYKSGLALDIYQPTKQKYTNNPVLIYIHGGAWIFGSKIAINGARFNGAFNQLRDNGYAIISPQYTLARDGKSPFPSCVQDIHDVLTWVEKSATKYNFDLSNVTIMGESAGAHIAMMCAVNGSTPHNYTPNGVIDIYGPTDLYALYQDQMPRLNETKDRLSALPQSIQKHLNLEKVLFGFDPSTDSIRTRSFADLYSPLSHITLDFPDLLIIHGDKDEIVPIDQSERLVRACDSLNIEYQYHVIPGVRHGLIHITPEQKDQVQSWIVAFVLERYRTSKTQVSQ